MPKVKQPVMAVLQSYAGRNLDITEFNESDVDLIPAYAAADGRQYDSSPCAIQSSGVRRGPMVSLSSCVERPRRLRFHRE